MLFNSLHFLLFFPIVAVLFFALPQRFRWILLLAASYYFYMCWRAEYALLILASTLVSYCATLLIARSTTTAGRRLFLLMGLIANLGPLIVFKYFNFFNESLRDLMTSLHLNYPIPSLSVLLPVGISFYTFQTLSYTIDVYRGNTQPERHLGIFALFVAFFPQLVAGPIERSTRLLPQFYERMTFDYDRVTSGLKLMAWGFFKKVVVADNVALAVNAVFSDPRSHSGVHLVIATVLFAFQVYCDFSGYSDIAIGGARVLGFRLMCNFNRPFHARSIPEFWQRWHISLSTWFRDYLYIPLGGSRVPYARWLFNIFVTFALSGLWHGADWNFVAWGAIHGVYVIASIVTTSARARLATALGLKHVPRLHALYQQMVTFALFCLALAVFRANGLSDAFYIVTHLFSGWSELPAVLLDSSRLQSLGATMGLGAKRGLVIVAALALLEGVQFIQARTSISSLVARQPLPVRWAMYYALILFIVFAGAFNRSQQFFYFQF